MSEDIWDSEQWQKAVKDAEHRLHAAHLLVWLVHFLPKGESLKKAILFSHGLGD